jgi:hypothetical protein
VNGCRSLIGDLLPQDLRGIQIAGERRAGEAWVRVLGQDADAPSSSRQKVLDAPIITKKHNGLLETTADDQDRARLLAVSSKESSAWLHALPLANLGLLLDPEHLRISVGVRLGAKLCEKHQCRNCDAEVDERGVHGLSCKRSEGRSSRHSELNNIDSRTLSSNHVNNKLEPSGLVRTDGKRPDGMTKIPWKRGRCLLWDVTCVDTLAPSYVSETSKTAGAAAEKAEKKKDSKYAPLTRDYLFAPIGVGTLGSWGEGARTFFRELSQRLRATTGEPIAGAFLRQRISMAIQRGNATSMAGTLPRGEDLGELYFL